MILRVPHYYKAFHCIASICKDNCCIGGWEIDIDEETAEHYLSLRGAFGERLKNAVERTDSGAYCFRLENGRCPFLDNQNLCEIYQRLGADKMGVVCAQFPRFTEYFGEVKETGLGLACEEAARIILEDKEAFLLESTLIEEEITEDSEYDGTLAKILLEYRSKLFLLLEQSGLSITEQLVVMLESAYEMQGYINDNHYELLEEFVKQFFTGREFERKRFEGVLQTASQEKGCEDFHLSEGITRILKTYLELEAMNDKWACEIHCVLDTLHKNKSGYGLLCREYESDTKAYAYQYGNIVKYYLFRYLLKAVYDHDLFGKVQMIVSNYFVLRDMDLYRWVIGGKRFEQGNREEVVHIFSREVEYSEDNLQALSEEFLFDSIFDRDSLIRLLHLAKNS